MTQIYSGHTYYGYNKKPKQRHVICVRKTPNKPCHLFNASNSLLLILLIAFLIINRSRENKNHLENRKDEVPDLKPALSAIGHNILPLILQSGLKLEDLLDAGSKLANRPKGTSLLQSLLEQVTSRMDIKKLHQQMTNLLANDSSVSNLINPIISSTLNNEDTTMNSSSIFDRALEIMSEHPELVNTVFKEMLNMFTKK